MGPSTRIGALGICLLLLGLASSCSRERVSVDDSGPTAEELEQMREVLTLQGDYYDQLATLAASQDTVAAYAQVTSLLSSDPNVDWATNNRTGINIQWANGLRGGLVLLPYGAQRMQAPPAPEPSPRPSPNPNPTSAVVPSQKKAIFLAPCYSEFRLWDSSVQELADTCLAKAGYSPFELYKDNECTLENFRTVASGGYGVVRIGSHGSAWPSDTDVQEVYVITGEVPTPETTEQYWAFLDLGMLAVIDYAGEQRYCITSSWFALHNNFGDTKPFISNGFCFGSLGHWLGGMVHSSQAAAAIGWDWSVYAGAETARTEYFFEAMCDTSRTEPLKLSEWMELASTTYMEENRVVTLSYIGDGDLALWSRLRADRIEPDGGATGTTVTVRGRGFGTTPGQLFFGSTQASNVSEWTDRQIVATVPDGLPNGVARVRVVLGGEESNPLDFTVGPMTVRIQPNPANGALGTPVSLEAIVSGGGPAAVDYEWSFGDDTPTERHSVNTVQHTYSDLGEYEITIRVLDRNSNETLATAAGEATISGESYEDFLHRHRYWYLRLDSNMTFYDRARDIENTETESMNFPIWAPNPRLRWSGLSFSADTLHVTGSVEGGQADSLRFHIEGTFSADGTGLESGYLTEYRSARWWWDDGRPLEYYIYVRTVRFGPLACDEPRCNGFVESGGDAQLAVNEVDWVYQAVSYYYEPEGQLWIDKHIRSVNWSDASRFSFSIR